MLIILLYLWQKSLRIRDFGITNNNDEWSPGWSSYEAKAC